MLATRIISRVTDEFQIKIPLRSLFESATVADMAALITQKNQYEGIEHGYI